MDLDPPPPAALSRPTRRILVPDSSPYDLEQLAGSWEGRSKVNRLLFVANSSPSLAGPALTLALAAIKEATLDVPLYENTFHMYRQHISAIESGDEQDPTAVAWHGSVKGNEVSLDREWIDKAKREAQSGLDKLEVELKGYMTNLIKESIRMGHRDLARFQYRIGDLQGAVRSYTKSREFCTTSQHVLEMCLGVIEIALDMSNYAFVRNYVVKAESAVDAAQASTNGNKSRAAPVNLPGMVAPAQDPIEAAKEKERKIVHERLTVAGGVAFLGSGAFDKAARAFTDIGSEALNAPVGHFIPPADVALYAVLTGLACFDRTQIRARLLENANLRPFLDLEPYLRDIVRAFYDSKFKEGLELLHRHSVRRSRSHLPHPSSSRAALLTRERIKLQHRPLLDVHLAPHLSALHKLIRSRALLAYFQPFASVSLARMAAAFGTDEASQHPEIVELIATGQLKARIDSAHGVLVAKRKDARGEAFRHALDEGEKMQKRASASQLRSVPPCGFLQGLEKSENLGELTPGSRGHRMKLLQADIVVKPAKGGSGQQQHLSVQEA
ncbi:SPOSA6832_03998, partial [Sporobolomyces salmonicolor]